MLAQRADTKNPEVQIMSHKLSAMTTQPRRFMKTLSFMGWHNTDNGQNGDGNSNGNSPWGRPDFKSGQFKSGPGSNNPWGSPGNGAGGASGKTPEELIADIQGLLRGLFGGGGSGSGNGRGGGSGGGGWSAAGGSFILVILLLGSVLLWMLSGFYTVQPNEIGLNLIFGKFTGKTTAGLNYNYPYPIGQTIKLPVFDQNIIDVGQAISGSSASPIHGTRDLPEESLMLTGDENIADVKFRVSWQIDPVNPEYFAFNIRRPEDTVKAVAESAMREIIGRSQIQRILTSDRKVIEPQVQELMQKVLDDYKVGVKITQVQLQSVDPPAQVISAFRDVTAAQQDLQRLRNQAETYANSVVPEARGDAARIIQNAEAYREQTIAQANGQASRFSQVLAQYQRAPDITRQRLYYEMMEQVLGNANKIIIEQGSTGQALPLLPLGNLGGLDAPLAQKDTGAKP